MFHPKIFPVPYSLECKVYSYIIHLHTILKYLECTVENCTVSWSSIMYHPTIFAKAYSLENVAYLLPHVSF